jgi:Na+/H+ antiporter NhaA
MESVEGVINAIRAGSQRAERISQTLLKPEPEEFDDSQFDVMLTHSERKVLRLHPWVAFMILPLFAFANAGVSLDGVTLEGLTSMLPLGIIAGLFIGKPLGISLFCWLALKLKLASLPHGTTCRQIMAVGVLCG